MEYAEYKADKLWILCLQNDRKAFKFLFEKEFESLLAYGLKITNNQADTKDAIQEIFTDLWEKKSIRNIQNIKFYLLRSLKYKLIKNIQSGKVVDINTLSKNLLYTSLDGLNEDDRTEMIRSMLSQLPKNQQEILHLKYYQGLSNTQISEILNVKYQSVSNNLHRIISVFRKKIKNKVSLP